MIKRMALIIVVILVIFGGTFGWDYVRSIFIKEYFSKFRPPPVTISTSIAKQQNWQPKLTAVGSLVAVNGVDVTSEVSGQILRIFFKSGQMVKTGKSLIQLDDSIDQQTLKNDQAQLTLNEVNYERQFKLYRRNATSKSALDAAKARLLQSKAAVTSDQVMIQKKNIKAPFSGKIGIDKRNIGEYVKPGQALVSLQALDPLFVDFTLPEQDLPLIQTGQMIHISIEAFPKKIFIGEITAINSKVDINTRSIEVRGVVPNESSKLYPGVFANVKVLLLKQDNVVTIPQTAVSYSLYGNSVYVISQKGVDKKGKPILIATQKFVKLGEREGTVIAVLEGVKTGDQVITSGQLKLHSGAQVLIDNKVKLN